MAGLLNRLFEMLRGTKTERESDSLKSRARRRLRMELLEGRQLMAANITGTVYHDLLDDGTVGSDPRLSGVNVALFRDGGNNTYDNGAGDDIAAGTTQSAATTGAFSFSVNTAGIYYLVQTGTSGSLIQKPTQKVQTIVVTPTQVAGSLFTAIDSFDTTEQVVTASNPGTTPANSALAAPEAIGGERDEFVDATAGTVSIQADNFGTTNFLAFGVDPGSNGTRTVTYDGADGDATTLANNGLGGVDLTSAGSAVGFRFAIGGEAGTQLKITVHSGINSSSVTVPIPTTSGGSPTATLDVPFSSFNTLTGGGASFSSVGALVFEVSGPDAADAIIDNIAMYGPTVLVQNIANLTPLTLGNQVFADVNDNGQFDTGATPPEVGISGLTLQLFDDTNNNGTYDAGTDVAALNSLNVPITTTTNSSGVYTFTNLLPGNYFVIIPSSQTATGGPAAGYIASSTTSNGGNNANVGTALVGTGIVSSLASLASGSGPTTDGDTDVNTDLSFDFGLVPQFDLTVAKTSTATVAKTGTTITYTINARNDGPSPASGVELTDNVPDGLQIVSVTSNVNTDTITIPSSAQDTTPANPDDITITVGNLAASNATQRTITVIATVLAVTTGTGSPAAINNSVTIAGLGTELTTLPNTSTLSLPVQLTNDLVVTKTVTTNPTSTATPPVAAPGSTVTYTIVARNDGPSRATNVRVTDDIPNGLQILTATSSDGTDVVTIPPSATDTTPANPDDLTVAVGDLLVGAGNQTTITVTALVLSSTSGIFTNTATIASTNTAENSDPTPGNNTSAVDANAQRTVDLVVVKSIATNPASTASPATAAPNTTFTYTILARNDGPFDATTVRVTDNIPDGIKILSATSTDNTDTINIPASATDNTAANNDDLTVDIGNLAVGVGAQVTIQIVGVVLPGTIGNFTNVATIAPTDTTVNIESSGTLANNTSSVVANAPRTVDLAVVKTGPTTAISGNTITYTMSTVNNGPSDATGVQVVDNIPDGIRVISATVNGTAITIPASASDTTSSNPDDLTFLVGNLASAGTNNTIIIVAAILPGSTAALVNSAVISTTDTATVEGPTTNNTSVVTTTLTQQNDVAISKSGPATAPAGSTVTYTMNVTNNGPSTATAVAVSDTLPTGLTFISGTSLIGSSTAGTVAAGSNNSATVTIPTLAPGETAIVTVVASVASTTTAGNITNSVTVTAANDSVSTNNNATATTNLTVPVATTLSGRLYIDTNNDGIGQSTEPGIPNVKVTLTGTATGSSATVTQTVTTDSTGAYSFANVASGTYTVTTPQPQDFNFRAANPGTTGGTAGTLQIASITPAGIASTSNNIGFTRVFSKRLFLASGPTGI